MRHLLRGLALLVAIAVLPAPAGAQMGNGMGPVGGGAVSAAAIAAALGGTPTLQEGAFVTDNVLVAGAGATGAKDSGVALKTTMVARSVWGNNTSSTSAPTELTKLTMGDGDCTNPTYSFGASTSTGLASLTANETDLCVNGNRFIRFGSSNATNYFRYTVSSIPTIQAIGTNMDIQFSGSGTGGVKLMTNAAGATILRALGVASTVNNLNVTSSATGNPVLIAADGETNVKLRINGKGNLGVETAGPLMSITNGIGYDTGAGGNVAQGTNKTTGFTCSKPTCQITWNAAALAANTNVSATWTNTFFVRTTDQVVCTHLSGGTLGAYIMMVAPGAGGTGTATLRNITGGSLSEGPVFQCTLVKAVTA